jgi:hypothetical protein
MGLTLNDKQEKALRAWWHSAHAYASSNPAPHPVAFDIMDDLYGAVAPLMKPWRVDGLGRKWVLVGPRGVRIIMDEQNDEYGKQIWAKVVCNLLNESEGMR